MLQTLNPLTDVALQLRPGTPTDAEICGRICFDAFKAISEQHNFPPDFSTLPPVQGLIDMLFSHPQVYSVVAEVAGQVMGSNFLWETSAIAGVGPISVAPAVQNAALGRRLMTAILERAEQQKFAGVRLVQAAYHNRSLSLYTKLGFDVQEPLANLQGPPLHRATPGYPVRPATEADLEACDRLHQGIHGFSRRDELRQAVAQGTATVVEHQGRITGYTTGIGFFGHAVGTSNTDLQALIGAAPAFNGPGFLLPTRNSSLLRWCLEHGLRVVQPMTLMSLGLYNQPAGAFLPSIIF